MIIITDDIIEGAEASHNSSEGPSAKRIIRVKTTEGESLHTILGDSSIPAIFSAYPGNGSDGALINLPIIALDKTIRPINSENTLYEIVVDYRRPTFTQKPPSAEESDSVIQVGSSVSTTQTQRDKDDNPLIIELSGQPDQLATVDIQIPETVLVFERREAATPRTKSIANTGKVNSVALGSGTYAIGTLLCLGIEGTSTDDGSTWQVVYRFQYNPKGWEAEAVYIDPETGQPHVDVDLESAGVGWIREEIYESINFASLSLPF